MTSQNRKYTETKFTPYGLKTIALGLFGIALFFLVGSFFAAGTTGASADQDATAVRIALGRFFQVGAVFFVLTSLVDIPSIPITLQGRIGTSTGKCPYCGADKTMEGALTYNFGSAQIGSGGDDCDKCKQRIILKNRRFYQLEPLSSPDARLAPISKGIGLVRGGIIVACFLPVAFVVGVFSGIFTFSLFNFFTPIVLCALISFGMQMNGMFMCLKAPDRFSGRQFVLASLWIEGIVVAALALQSVIGNTPWLDVPIQAGTSAAGYAFLTYLAMLSGFLQRPDLALTFASLRSSSVLLAIFGLSLTLPIARGYEGQIIVCIALHGFPTLVRYIGNLDRLAKYMNSPLNSPA